MCILALTTFSNQHYIRMYTHMYICKCILCMYEVATIYMVYLAVILIRRFGESYKDC